jgi:hypothetical protein
MNNKPKSRKLRNFGTKGVLGKSGVREYTCPIPKGAEMNKQNRIHIGVIAAFFLLACACPVSGLPGAGDPPSQDSFPTSEPIIPTLPPIATPQSLPSAEILLTDDFSVESAEMETYADDNGSTETRDGVYVLRAIGDLWHWGRSVSQFDDTIIEVDVFMELGPSNDNAGFGVICRLSEREDTSIDGYLFAISGDGYYTIRSITSSNMSALVDWTYSDVVRQGNTTNQIRATCDGDDLILEVNGEVIATAAAIPGGSTFGSIAFAGISFESAERVAEIHFDNLVVSRP